MSAMGASVAAMGTNPSAMRPREPPAGDRAFCCEASPAVVLDCAGPGAASESEVLQVPRPPGIT